MDQKNPNNNISEVSGLIRKDFNLGSQELVHQQSMDELHQALSNIVQYLIDKDFERLLHALYRIDVSEAKVKLALSSGSPEQIAPSIARLIIDREFQKVETRRKYS